jgi:hypothetical protein
MSVILTFSMPNKRTSGNGAIALLFHAERLRRAVPEHSLQLIGKSGKP